MSRCSTPSPAQWFGQLYAATWTELGELSHPRDGQGTQAQRMLPATCVLGST